MASRYPGLPSPPNCVAIEALIKKGLKLLYYFIAVISSALVAIEALIKKGFDLLFHTAYTGVAIEALIKKGLKRLGLREFGMIVAIEALIKKGLKRNAGPLPLGVPGSVVAIEALIKKGLKRDLR